MRRSIQFILLISLLSLFTGCSSDSPVVAVSSAKEISTFEFLASDNAALSVDVAATIAGTSITAYVPEGTDVTALVASFSTTGATVTVATVLQVSGVTANDFTSPVTYTVTADDASTQDYTVTVEEASSAKEITAFSFLAAENAALSSDVVATIAGTSISAIVPNGTDVTALVATFTTTGASVRIAATTQVSGVTANDFSSPATYTVVAGDASTQDYTVTVTQTSGDKEITAFSFLAADNVALASDVVATIAGTSITAMVPAGTDVTALVASFTTTGASVRIAATTQVSGVTTNDFSSPVTYTVVAEDASTQDYSVTVDVISSDKEITSFSFLASDNAALSTDVVASIAGTSISATVPGGTDISALVATFTTSGASVRVAATTQVSGVTPNDFSSPVTYTVVAEDASTQDYTVTLSFGTVWYGDYTIYDAEDMAAISGYTEITGYLRINSDLTDLDGLSSLTTIGGMLLISNNMALTDITGLSSLTSVGARVEIFNNDALTSFSGLDNLATIGESLEITAHDMLTSLTGLSGLTTVGSFVEIAANSALTSISGLSNLSSISTSLILDNNSSLVSLAGLEQLTSLGIGDYDIGLEIKNCDALVNLTGLDNLTTVTGSVEIGHNDLLASLDGLGNLSTVGEDIMLVNNPALATLSHLVSLITTPSIVVGTNYFGGNASLTTIDIPNLEEIGILYIESNTGLTDLTGLPALATIDELHMIQNSAITTLGFGSTAATPLVVTGSIVIFRNALLEDLAGLEATTALTGYIKIQDNYALSSIAALDNVASIGSYLRVGSIDFGGNDNLTDIGFPSLQAIGDGLYIEDNDDPAFTSLTFGSLLSVGGEISIWGNANLLNLAGLANLTAVNGNLLIGDNPELVNISALGSVTSVSGTLQIEENNSLLNLAGLDALTTIGYDLVILNNWELVHINSLSMLSSLGGDLEINRNYDLIHVDGLAGLTALGGNHHLWVLNNSSLTNIDGLSGIQTLGAGVWISSNAITRVDLSSLQSVPDDLRIQSNGYLTNIDLRSVTSIGTDLIISNTSTLTSVRFDALTSIGRGVYISNTSGLSDLSILSGVAASTDALGGDLTLSNNTSLSNIDALGGFTSIAGHLDITNCDLLTSLNALSGITSLGGSLWIRGNAQITDLAGLASIASITDGLLMIDDNASLTALGLDALASLTWDLYIRNNPSLCNDLATALETQLIGHGWSRTAYISGNTGACP